MNIVSPDVCVITRIAMDHESWLGNDRESIGREKAGIMRSSVPCVISDHDPPQSMIDYASQLGTPLWLIDHAVGTSEQACFFASGRDRIALSLPGSGREEWVDSTANLSSRSARLVVLLLINCSRVKRR
jgi:dihydrofolate synthase/folylpolyglutamate synthase